MTLAGEFVIDPVNPVANVGCNGKLGSDGPETKAVTHIDSGDKSMVSIYFRPDEGVEQVPEFEVVILKDYATFWTDLSI